jgi:hypothetical protein
MHAVAEYALINQRMLLIEMLLIKMRRRQTNETRHKGPGGALLYLRAMIKVESERDKFPSEALY